MLVSVRFSFRGAPTVLELAAFCLLLVVLSFPFISLFWSFMIVLATGDAVDAVFMGDAVATVIVVSAGGAGVEASVE